MPNVAVSQSTGSSTSNASSSQHAGSYSGPDQLYYASGGLNTAGQYQYPGLYNQRYGDMLRLNAALYQDYHQAYGDTLGQIGAGTNQAVQGYQGLNTAVQNQLAGAEQSQRLDIADRAQQQGANARQSLINSGLGNTTIGVNAQRAVDMDRQRAELALSNQFAQTRAGYQADLGSRAEAARMQGTGMMGQLGASYMGGMGGYRLAAPDWAPNTTRSDSASASDSTQTSQQLSSSTQIGAPDISAPGPPQGLNAGTPGPLYSPGGLLGAASTNNYSQLSGNAGALQYGFTPIAGSGGSFGGSYNPIFGLPPRTH